LIAPSLLSTVYHLPLSAQELQHATNSLERQPAPGRESYSHHPHTLLCIGCPGSLKTRCLHATLTWASKTSHKAQPNLICTPTYICRQESELANNIRKATSIDEVSPKRTFPRAAKAMRRNSPWCRKACARMHCVHMGSQELSELLAGHESVGLTPTVSDMDLISLSHVETACTTIPTCATGSWASSMFRVSRSAAGALKRKARAPRSKNAICDHDHTETPKQC
jgi:hypothetical protein